MTFRMPTFISMQMTLSCIVVLLLDNKPFISSSQPLMSSNHGVTLYTLVAECCSQVKKKNQTLQGTVIELVKEYKYLGIIVDGVLSFSSHITQLKKKIKMKLGFNFRNKFCFSFNI